jgi:alanine racemase
MSIETSIDASIEQPASRPATLRVDLDALARNYRLLRERAKPGECAAVVKADAYGLGVERVARRLLREGCRRFFVATLAEARELRALAPDAEIGVFEGALASTADSLVELEARPVLNTIEQIERWRGKGRALLHLDTGMNRLGLRAADVAALAQRKDLLDALTLDFVMTHLACADEPDHPLNAEQLARFEQLCGLLPRARTSIGNSAGTLIDAAHRGDLARPGIALYGGNPFCDRSNPMEAVVTLTAPILQLHSVAAPEPVGYGATYVANPPARIAVVGIGYADGYPRNLGNNGTAAVQGRRVPVVGRVSMDLISIDVAALAGGAVAAGDAVELIGPTIGVDEVAAAAGTISYEILTGMGRRLVREYVEND